MRRSLGTGVAALALALLVGCSGPDGESSSADGAAGGGTTLPEPAAGEDSGGAPGAPDTERQVVTTASASLAVDDPAGAAQRVSELVESAGGRVDERTEQAVPGEDGTEAVADLVVRVPSDELTGVLSELEQLGDVDTVSVSRSDVTSTAVDLDARITALQTSVGRLLALMDRAASTAALLEAEQVLSERQQQLESLQSQRALLADQVELSTLRVHLEPHGVTPVGGPDGFVEGLGTGWRALTTTLGAVVVALGVVLPWLALGGLVTAAVLVTVRLARRRTAVEVPAPPQA